MGILMIIFGIVFGYQLFLYVVAMNGRQGQEWSRVTSLLPINKMLVVIPAHNEENVISNLIGDLQMQTTHCDIIVVADHCTDRTIELCESYGVYVYVRKTGILGKQFAIFEFFRTQLDQTKWDSVTILDADNRLDNDYIEKMMNALERHEVVQAYLDVVQSSNWIAKGYEINYRVMNGVLQRARQSMGLTAFLGGTGWACRWSVLQQVPFDCTTVTDDLEYTVKLWLADKRVEYLEDVKVYDEKPRSMKVSYVQRLRWMRGGYQVLFKYFKSIIIQGLIFKKRLTVFDLLISLSLYLVGAINNLMILLTIMGISGAHWSWMSYPIYQLSYLGLYILIDTFSPFRLMLWLPASLIVNILAIPMSIHGLITWKKTAWVRTEHYGKIIN